MSYVSYKVRFNRMNAVRTLLLLSMLKKVKQALRTRLSGNKITWTETFVRLKEFAKMKSHLKPRDFSPLWKLTNTETYLKKTCNLVKPHFFLVYTTFPQITQKDTCHWLEPITVILESLKIFTFTETNTHFRTIIFSQSPRFQFSYPILDGLCVSFNVHHFFMRKQFMCVDCYTGRLTFSNIILHKIAIA